MKLKGLWILAMIAAAAASASAQTACEAATFPKLTSNLAFYIWSDKYVYQPGEAMTLKWTVKTNGDTYAYTIFGHITNNQTGKRLFAPTLTENATDIFGKTASDGYQTTPLASGDKQVLAGDGGLLGAALTIPAELGMHTIALELRDCTGSRVVKTAYMKIGVVDGFENISGNIESSRTLVNTKAYRVSGVVFVRNNAVLTIEPGTFVFGQPGAQPPSVLVISRRGRIVANGTRQRPIVMTSSQPFGQRNRGDWGGLIMLGRAPINVGANSGGQTNTAGEFAVEGLPASDDSRYGGTDNNHSCGSLRYVRVEYAGSILSPNNETNSFTWAGCGKGTVAEFLQASYGLDDAFEWFGGSADAKYLVAGLHADDYIDYQLGYTGRLQFGVFYQSPDVRGNKGVEGDNSEYNNSATPFSHPIISNMTFIGSGQAGFDEATSPGVHMRRGSQGELYNSIITNFVSPGLFVDAAVAQAQIDAGEVKMNGILMWRTSLGTNAENTVSAQTEATTRTFAAGERGQGRNFIAADPLLRRPFEFSDPDFSLGFGSPGFGARWIAPPIATDGFFDVSANFLGGIGEINWLEEWTSFLQETDIQ